MVEVDIAKDGVKKGDVWAMNSANKETEADTDEVEA